MESMSEGFTRDCQGNDVNGQTEPFCLMEKPSSEEDRSETFADESWAKMAPQKRIPFENQIEKNMFSKSWDASSTKQN